MANENLGETLAKRGENRIHMCGRFTVRLGGERVEEALPGRQGRMLLAFLVLHRFRATPRRELQEALWPGPLPPAADSALAALLAKLRRTVGTGSIAGKHDVRLLLPANVWVDLEAAQEALHRAEAAVALNEWTRAWAPARVSLHITMRTFMPGYEAPWIAEVRRRFEDMLLRSHECVAASALGIGGAELAAAERSGRRLTELAPYRESGYRLLMQALAARDSVGEALLIYEQLRKVLRDELGVSPGASSQGLQRQLLGLRR